MHPAVTNAVFAGLSNSLAAAIDTGNGEEVAAVLQNAEDALDAGQISIHQRIPKPAGALLPGNAAIFDQKRGDQHPYPVVHPAGLPELPHPGVHHRITGLPLAPSLEPFVNWKGRRFSIRRAEKFPILFSFNRV